MTQRLAQCHKARKWEARTLEFCEMPKPTSSYHSWHVRNPGEVEAAWVERLS